MPMVFGSTLTLPISLFFRLLCCLYRLGLFFKCRLEDLPRLLRLLLGLHSISDQRNSCAKPRAFRRFYFQKSLKPSGRQRVKLCILFCYKKTAVLWTKTVESQNGFILFVITWLTHCATERSRFQPASFMDVVLNHLCCFGNSFWWWSQCCYSPLIFLQFWSCFPGIC